MHCSARAAGDRGGGCCCAAEQRGWQAAPARWGVAAVQGQVLQCLLTHLGMVSQECTQESVRAVSTALQFYQPVRRPSICARPGCTRVSPIRPAPLPLCCCAWQLARSVWKSYGQLMRVTKSAESVGAAGSWGLKGRCSIPAGARMCRQRGGGEGSRPGVQDLPVIRACDNDVEKYCIPPELRKQWEDDRKPGKGALGALGPHAAHVQIGQVRALGCRPAGSQLPGAWPRCTLASEGHMLSKSLALVREPFCE